MRRVLGLLVFATLLAPALAAVATGQVEDFADHFDTGDYSGNSGSREFDGPWVEFGDPGGGGHEAGSVYVGAGDCPRGDCLHIDGHGVIVEPYGVTRSADLSDFETAELRYEIAVTPGLVTTSELDVQVWDGHRWVTVEEHSLSSPTHHENQVPVTEHMGEMFAVRFLVVGLDSGLVDLTYTGETVIDDVRIVGIVDGAEPSTTSSSTSSVPPSSTKPAPASSTSSSAPASSSTTTSSRAPSSVPSSTISDPGTSATTSPRGAGSGPVTTSRESSTTTTTAASTTSSTRPALTSLGSGKPPPDSGLREPAVGLIADYRPGMMGDLGMEEVEVLGVELQASFSMLVETFETMRIWIAVLALVITGAVVSGMDWRRSKIDPIG